jgi:hypothetical protein
MKFVALSLCLLVSGAAIAQKTAAPAKKDPRKTAIAGTILNTRKQPVAGVQAFIYKKDSIAASGYTDDMGYYETNATVPGIYNLKLVYPSAKVMMVTGVPVKNGVLTTVSLKAIPPIADTTIAYADLVPAVTTDKKKKS